MPPPVEPPPINPAVPVPPGWLAAGIALALLAVAAVMVMWRWQAYADRRARRRQLSAAARLRAAALDRADAAITAHGAGGLTAAQATGVVSAQLRMLAGALLGKDLDLMTLSELDAAQRVDHRIGEVVDYVRRCYPITFAGQCPPEVAELLDEGRELIAAWA